MRSLCVCRQSGTAITEVIVALLAIAPFLIGIPLLGKQLDVKHKSLDATRYAVWERTVWRDHGHNRKEGSDIALEARDRALGDPRAAVVTAETLRNDGVTENRFWRDAANQRLLAYAANASPLALEQRAEREPVEVGALFVPAFVYGGGVIGTAASVLRVQELGMSTRTFASASTEIALRPLLTSRAQTPVSLRRADVTDQTMALLTQRATGAILSDTWSSRDEAEFGRRVDALTTDEFVATIEAPSRILALNALGKGQPLYGEGQYAWDPELRPSSITLPRAYVERR
jgi:hypothetical protein